jgi:hypothetical protein
VIRRSLALPVLALLLCSCGGGQLSKKELQKEVESIQSLAAEGALVARDAADGSTTDVFVRVHSQYLQKAADKVEQGLSSAQASGSLDADRAKAQRLAARVADELGRLHADPGDRARAAAQLAGSLDDDAKTAEELAK